MHDQSPPLTKQFLRYLRIERGLSENTIANYQTDLARLTHYAYQFGKPIDQLKERDLQAWIGHLSRNGLAPATVRRIASAARGFYRFLQIDGHVSTLPTEDLQTPPPVAYNPTFLTETEVERLLAAPDLTTKEGIRDRAILELMYATGLRASELASLRQKQVDLETGIVSCMGKGRKERSIPIGQSAVSALHAYIATKRLPRAINLHLFLNRDEPLTRQFLWTVIKHYGTIAGIKHISPHTLRHTFATHLLQHGADIKHVQALLGHSNLSTTEIYTHVTTQHLQRSYDRNHPRRRRRRHAVMSAPTTAPITQLVELPITS